MEKGSLLRPNFKASIFKQKNVGKTYTLFIGPWINSHIFDKPRYVVIYISKHLLKQIPKLCSLKRKNHLIEKHEKNEA